MGASVEIQTKMYSLIKALGLKVYDYRPSTKNYPFVIIGDDRLSGLNVKNGDYVTINSTLLVFSVYQGKKEVKQILEQLKTLCVSLQLDTSQILGATVTDCFTMVDDANEVTQGVLTIQYKILGG